MENYSRSGYALYLQQNLIFDKIIVFHKLINKYLTTQLL